MNKIVKAPGQGAQYKVCKEFMMNMICKKIFDIHIYWDIHYKMFFI